MFEEFSTYLMKFLECHKLFSVLSSQLYHKYHESISVHLKAIIFIIQFVFKFVFKIGGMALMFVPSLFIVLGGYTIS